MSESFDNWRRADQQWAERNRDLVVITFRQFLEDGKWPEVEELQRFLHQSGVRSIDVRAVADSKPSVPGQMASGFRPSIVLGARYLLGLPEAQPMLSLIVKATALAVQCYLTTGVAPSDMIVRRSDPALGLFSPPTLDQFFEFVSSDYPNVFAGGATGSEWALNVNQATVMKFEHVSSPSEYVERQLEMIKGWSQEQDIRLGVSAPEEPATAFVVMPFNESWSEKSHAFIMSAVGAQGGALEAIRADGINQAGRITDQIVEALRTCDVVVADISSDNMNVAWELGYAYSQGKPCAIVMQKGNTAPFDIYDHRRVDYSDPPSAEEVERLAAILRNAIGR
jgi:nucleoside 2-deoxyribosyltransferase-like protein